VRHLLAGIRAGQVTARQAADALELSRRRIYQLYSDYLRACALGAVEQWVPGCSGGNHRPALPQDVEELLRNLLGAKPPLAYGFAASEVHRRLGLKLDRATVRRWAIGAHLQHAQPVRRPRAAVRRWQCSEVGALWQLDASPHRWFGDYGPLTALLDMLDDCSRVITGARLYVRETLLAYFDFLPRAFEAYGLPLALYVDYHSFFFSQEPEALTQLGRALKFYGVSLKYAPTPEAKGKIERQHLFWQNRLPPLFTLERVGQVAAANVIIDQLWHHHNQNEIHREIARTPDSAWQAALDEGRSVLRPAPKCPWWKYIWSLRSTVRVGPDGRVPVGTQRLRVELPPRQILVRCLHPSGAITILKEPPNPLHLPIVVLNYPLHEKVQL
jgi:hypothetical protein